MWQHLFLEKERRKNVTFLTEQVTETNLISMGTEAMDAKTKQNQKNSKGWIIVTQVRCHFRDTP